MIYFAQVGDGDRKRIKIGFTSYPEQRMKGLRAQFNEPVKMLGLMEGGWEQEQELHVKFEFCRALGHNELFHPSAELEAFMKPHLVPNES